MILGAVLLAGVVVIVAAFAYCLYDYTRRAK